jgi:glycopeptide antibiotics resistance protein
MTLLKKIAVLLPVTVLTFFFFRDHYARYYSQVSQGRLALLVLTLFVLYAWIGLEVLLRRQKTVTDIGLQSSFYLYVFMVLTLTGYFILFRELAVHGWWERMELRVERRDHVNLKLFKIFRIYRLSDKQVVGNLIMLLPLGIYLPLLYRRAKSFFAVSLAAFLISVSIELLQLATSFRSADVDDVLLNTLGAMIGYLIFLPFRSLLRPERPLPLPASA